MKTKPKTAQTALRRRIRQFYQLLSDRQFARCHDMIDPSVRCRPESVTLLQYTNAASEFLDHCGSISVVEFDIDLHLNEPSRLYEDRDFAIGKTLWQDAHGEQHVFAERWVREGRSWYTRSTGFVVPDRSAR